MHLLLPNLTLCLHVGTTLQSKVVQPPHDTDDIGSKRTLGGQDAAYEACLRTSDGTVLRTSVLASSSTGAASSCGSSASPVSSSTVTTAPTTDLAAADAGACTACAELAAENKRLGGLLVAKAIELAEAKEVQVGSVAYQATTPW
jgi:hypothetical protein